MFEFTKICSHANNNYINIFNAKRLSMISRIFLIETVCEIAYGIYDIDGGQIFEIFNIKITVLLILFLFNSIAFAIASRMVSHFIELEEESMLTI